MRTGIYIAALLLPLLIFAWWRSQPATQEAEMARQLLGERWYSLSLEGRHLGYWHTRNYRDDAGNWAFESEQRFAMNPYDSASTVTRRVFAARPPHRLLRAEHSRQRRDLAEGLRIEPAEEGYRAVRMPEDGGPGRELDFRYTLADYLEFELWLSTGQPAAGAKKTVATLDFDRAELVHRGFDVVSVERSSYVIENAAPWSATRIHLDERFIPRSMRIAGLFDLERTTRALALAPRSTLQAASYHIPTDRRLSNPARVSRLVLAVEGHDAPDTLFDGIERDGRRWRLSLESPPGSAGPVNRADLAETVRIPSAHPHILALANTAIGGLNGDRERARALTMFVHDFLTYQPGVPPQSILNLLADRRGDCTEFADLLTTLARSQGIPARTVFGLAYADGPAPAFAYHAWNELHVDGRWTPVDPTWGELRVDATHIPLPTDETAAMSLLTGSVDLSFSVLEVAHFPD